MKKLYALFLIICLSQLNAQITTMKQYMFGHSLMVHSPPVNPTPSDETTIPHWISVLSDEAGKNYAAAGQYGFLPQHRQLPPISQWGFDTVTPAWDDWLYDFDSANFNNVLITAGNFVQWQGPSVNYFSDTVSPLSCTREINDWVKTEQPDCKIYIYENWPDMAGYLSSGFPPNPTEWSNYLTYLDGTFHDWWIEYHDSLLLQRPLDSFRMIPVGPILSTIWQTAPYNTIPMDSLFEDDAPHGRPTTYFLAALITYMATYQEIAPISYQAPSLVHSTVRNNYNSLINLIWNELLSFNISGTTNSRVFYGSAPTTSINNNNQEKLVLYPNPSNGKFYLSNNSYKVVSITNILGEVVNIAITNNEIDLTSQSNGVYFIKFNNNSIVKVIKH